MWEKERKKEVLREKIGGGEKFKGLEGVVFLVCLFFLLESLVDRFFCKWIMEGEDGLLLKGRRGFSNSLNFNQLEVLMAIA